MLPFLNQHKMGSMMTNARKSDGTGSLEPAASDDKENHTLMGIAQELIAAVHAKDAKAVASALEAAVGVLNDDNSDEAEEGET